MCDGPFARRYLEREEALIAVASSGLSSGVGPLIQRWIPFKQLIIRGRSVHSGDEASIDRPSEP